MKKGLRLLCVFSIFVFALTGCSLPFGTPSAEKLIQGMTEYTYESAMVNFDFLVEGNVSVDGYEMEINTKTNANLECQKTKRGMLIYVNGSSKNNGVKMPIEMYVEYEGDDCTEYTYEEVQECWVYKEYEAELNEDSFADLQDALNAELARGEVAGKTEKREGVECYVLSATITGDDLADIGDIIMDIEADFFEDTDIDLEDLYDYITLDCTYYIDKEEGCLVQAVFDFSNSSFDDIAEELTSNDVYDDLELEMDEISIALTISDYDEVEVEIPDEVLDEAVSLSSLVAAAPDEEDEYDDEWEEDNWDNDGDDNWDDSGNDLGDYDYDYDYDIEDREAGTIIELPDYWDYSQTICEFRVPDGFYCSGTYSSSDFYDMMPTDDYTGPYMDFYVQNYLRTSDYDAYMYDQYDTGYYTGYELQAIELDTSFRGNPVYLLHIAYECSDDYVLENYNIITPYTNSHGEDSFITIEFYSGGEYMDPDSAKELFDAIFNY
ncbi:MAG: DUF6612 family protein [Lachnospiraceae bacterium]